jgi:hypothetical protein
MFAAPNRPTPYVPYFPNEYPFIGGYTTEKVNDNGLHLIGFLGNSMTPLNVIRDSAKYRAAEVALRNGYKYIYIFKEGGGPLVGGGYYVLYSVAMHNEFLKADFIDAAQLMNVLRDTYRP